MQYHYVYTTSRREAGCHEFSDLLDAVAFMNSHCEQSADVIKAEVLDAFDGNKVVCSRRIKL